MSIVSTESSACVSRSERERQCYPSVVASPARSHPGPHWWAAVHPRCPRRSSGTPSGTPLWAPPAALRSGSRPRRHPGCPTRWTWCRRQWSPGFWILARSWPGWTAQTAAPEAGVCLRTRCCEGPTRAPGTRPARAVWCLRTGQEEGGEREEMRGLGDTKGEKAQKTGIRTTLETTLH